ncbi:DEAD/DEAH box helicase [Cytobacillus purgationiresistens]|uniref:SNF2 family DNA or RNA helicase n=1 Tax=Cytobacillus purgationiresistens TaxID=863449 RepID=A0ABU0AIZ5_9BACI|nr:DEAD/DEAH box helicase [Cytobacillus purgationiresistens]MDQ0271239.1 SNF2 family DNA or RNA helicase [Cytobacillus purgationiresistens]
MFTTETNEQPKMFQVFSNLAWHEVFCYALAYEKKERNEDKLLLSIISGSDSALQSIKGTIDLGSRGINFGYGDKGLTGYKFTSEKSLYSEKGHYERFPMTLNQNRKALAIVHDDLLNNNKYVLSFDGNVAGEIATLLGGVNFGLHILPEWEDIVFKELIIENHLIKHNLYFDRELFPEELSLYSIQLTEEQADAFIENLLKEGKIKFPREGSGDKVDQISDLTSYLMDYNDAMVKSLSESVKPLHNPLNDEALEYFKGYPTTLFPVQSHVASAVVKKLRTNKSVIIQGEMSTGKSKVMTAIADGYQQSLKGNKGYHVCLMCPPSLTKKWPEEIKSLIPNANVIVIKESAALIRYHAEWMRSGRTKPTVPTFFIISFTTMRNDARIVPAVTHTYKGTAQQGLSEDQDIYKNGFYCPSCGHAHQTIEKKMLVLDEDGNEVQKKISHNMTAFEFGDTRRIANSSKAANAFCSECDESLWTRKVPTRFKSIKEWFAYENKLLYAIKKNDLKLYEHVKSKQPNFVKSVGMPKRIATIEYIRRKMKNFFDISIIDEIHELRGGMTAQGHALGSLVAASKKVIGGTGTLFGGRALDIYYLLWRCFSQDMIAAGFSFEDSNRFNEEFGNIEETTYQKKSGAKEYSNTNSRGGDCRTTRKILPGISPFIYGKFLIQNTVNIRLMDVWPDPVELVDTPTIFVPIEGELENNYKNMVNSFEHAINNWEDGNKLYLKLTDYGVSYPDNPFTFPDAIAKNENGTKELIWKAAHIEQEVTLPKEKKLQEIIEGEISEGRKSIVYVRDTGSSVSERDIRPRLKKKLEEIGAKVCILSTNTTSTNTRSEWLKKKIDDEDFDVCIVSQELVKVGLDLLCTPTLVYYQFSWSLFTLNQSSRRSFRIGQDKECRLYYLSYERTYQEQMAQIVALKNKAAAAINGEVSSDGLSAMLGDDGDLQTLLIQSVKNGGEVLTGSAEDWINQTSDRAREILNSIGQKKKSKTLSISEQLESWIESEIQGETTKLAMLRDKELILDNIKTGKVLGFEIHKNKLQIDLLEAFGFDRNFVSDGAILYHISRPQQAVKQIAINSSHVKIITITPEVKKSKTGKRSIAENQLAFDLFA